MRYVEDELVVGRGEHPVHRNRELDDSEVRPEMSPDRLRVVSRQHPHQFVPNLLRQLGQITLRQLLHIGRGMDCFE